MMLVITAGTLILGACGGAAAQEMPSNTGQASSQQQNTLADNSAQPGQAMSLGDLARLVRAKKESDPKPGKTVVIDDDNMPRTGTGISVVGSTPDGSSDSAGRGSAGSGKVVLLDFWASWCGPCRQSVPDLKQLQKTYGSDQVEVISVNEDKDENAGRNFVAQNEMNWEQRFDSGGEMSRQYGVNAFPTFVLTDGNGKVLQRFVGEDPRQPLAGRIAPYLQKAPKGTS